MHENDSFAVQMEFSAFSILLGQLHFALVKQLNIFN